MVMERADLCYYKRHYSKLLPKHVIILLQKVTVVTMSHEHRTHGVSHEYCLLEKFYRWDANGISESVGFK